MSEDKKDLAVVVISYNTKDVLSDCLTSIYKAQQPQKGIEVIVVDNNSKDDSVAMIKRDFPQVKIIQNKENLGFSKANNIGIKNSNSSSQAWLRVNITANIYVNAIFFLWNIRNKVTYSPAFISIHQDSFTIRCDIIIYSITCYMNKSKFRILNYNFRRKT